MDTLSTLPRLPSIDHNFDRPICLSLHIHKIQLRLVSIARQAMVANFETTPYTKISTFPRLSPESLQGVKSKRSLKFRHQRKVLYALWKRPTYLVQLPNCFFARYSPISARADLSPYPSRCRMQRFCGPLYLCMACRFTTIVRVAI